MADSAPVRSIRVVATDLDGTLLRPDLTVSAFTREQLHRVVASGRMLVFVTGRPPRWMPPVLATTAHDGIAVCANGAVIMDVAAEQIVAHHPLSTTDLADVCAVIRAEMGADSRFAVEVAPVGALAANRLVHEEGFLPRSAAAAEVTALSTIVASDSAVKLLARGSGDVADTAEVAARVAAATGDLVTVSHSSRTHQLLEVAPPGVTKASTLAQLVTDAGFDSRQVVAFGDMPNDIPMLSWAGHAVVVEGAHPSVLAIADTVVPDPEHDGLGSWLHEHLE